LLGNSWAWPFVVKGKLLIWLKIEMNKTFLKAENNLLTGLNGNFPSVFFCLNLKIDSTGAGTLMTTTCYEKNLLFCSSQESVKLSRN
jgi:hypothetical protein